MTVSGVAAVRPEHDSLGTREVPTGVYYDIHTTRALKNFPISGIALSTYPEFIDALPAVKQVAAVTNCELGLLGRERADTIVAACIEIRAGHLHDQFVVDVIQGGAGTSPEVVNQVAFEAAGNNITISMAAEAGQLQLNAFEPIIGHSLFQSLNHLNEACRSLVNRCVVAITANHERMFESVTNSIGVITALSPYIGYSASPGIAKVALSTDRPVPELVVEAVLLSAAQVAALLAPETLISPRELFVVGYCHRRPTGKGH